MSVRSYIRPFVRPRPIKIIPSYNVKVGAFWVIEFAYVVYIDPPGPYRLDGHYFHTLCTTFVRVSIRYEIYNHATAIAQYTVYIDPPGPTVIGGH